MIAGCRGARWCCPASTRRRRDATGERSPSKPSDPDFPLRSRIRNSALRDCCVGWASAARDVRPWPAPGVAGARPARARLSAARCAPGSADADALARPGDRRRVRRLVRVTCCRRRRPEEEARTIALLMRQTLETPTSDGGAGHARIACWPAGSPRSCGAGTSPSTTPAACRWRRPPPGGIPAPDRSHGGRGIGAGAAARGAEAPAGRRRAGAGGVSRARSRALERRALRGLRPAPGIAGLREAARETTRTGARRWSFIDMRWSGVSRLWPTCSTAARVASRRDRSARMSRRRKRWPRPMRERQRAAVGGRCRRGARQLLSRSWSMRRGDDPPIAPAGTTRTLLRCARWPGMSFGRAGAGIRGWRSGVRSKRGCSAPT